MKTQKINLYISEMLLLSKKEKKARRVEFDRRRTLVHGKNHTGKSSLLKSIYRAFGAEPLLNSKFEEANVSLLVKFQIGNEQYEIVRDGDQVGIFNSTGQLIGAFRAGTEKLASFLGNLLDFTPLFQSRDGVFAIPQPTFLFMPYYIDQDTSWSKSWASFQDNRKVKDYRNESIRYHSGIYPNEYYLLKKELQASNVVLDNLRIEEKLAKTILKDISRKLSQTSFNVDIKAFKAEIVNLLAEAKELKEKEEKLKNDLEKLYNLQFTYEAQIKITKKAILEIHRDLAFATEKVPDEVDCPVCGAGHHNNFSERFQMARDERRSKDLLIELKRELEEVVIQIKETLDSLNEATLEVISIHEILEKKKNGVKFKDIIDNSGKNQIRVLFDEKKEVLKNKVMDQGFKVNKLKGQLTSFKKDNSRKEEVTAYYQTKLSLFLRKLDVDSVNEKEYKSILNKIESGETGSSKPRTLIAYYFTFFHLMREFSPSTYCPLIIDSPNQQDQDIEHIDKIMKFIDDHQPEDSQMILGLAETYGVDFNCKEIKLTEKGSLLSEEEYDSVYTELSEKLDKLWFSVK